MSNNEFPKQPLPKKLTEKIMAAFIANSNPPLTSCSEDNSTNSSFAGNSLPTLKADETFDMEGMKKIIRQVYDNGEPEEGQS